MTAEALPVRTSREISGAGSSGFVVLTLFAVTVLFGIVSALIIVARLLHAVGMSRPSPNPFRIAGTAGTWITLLLLSAWGLILAIRSF